MKLGRERVEFALPVVLTYESSRASVRAVLGIIPASISWPWKVQHARALKELQLSVFLDKLELRLSFVIFLVVISSQLVVERASHLSKQLQICNY